MYLIITGGYGFIGSALIRHILDNTSYQIINIDKLTYASNKINLKGYETSPRYKFFEIDICDCDSIKSIFNQFSPKGLIHLAAESHVDRSIDNPDDFIATNIYGTYNLLKNSLSYYRNSSDSNFIFHHVSTDEVYGDLSMDASAFTEQTPYNPSSPYSASKASSDHLIRAWNRTYKLPTIITNCSNNYGPFQSIEKFIPLVITSALNGMHIPIYGDGLQIRDWLYVEDHARAILEIFNTRKIGETFNIGGSQEKTNLEVVQIICSHLDDFVKEKPNNINSFTDLITFVEDRPGHDKRYAIDSSKISKQTGWAPSENFETGIYKTIAWYIDNISLYEDQISDLTKRRGSKK